MKKHKKIRLCYLLFRLIYENPWVKGKEMALALGRTGRGQTISSALRQLDNMYKTGISFAPRLVLNNYEGFETTALFCRKSGRYGTANIYWKLYKMKRNHQISSAFSLTGAYDFFITTRQEGLELNSIGLDISESMRFFDPVYTIPMGWRHPMKKCVRKFFKSTFLKGRLNRKIHKTLDWEDVDWKIYLSARVNLRKQFKQIARESGITSGTAKMHLLEGVIPCCTTANYFFPRGYRSYQKIFMRIRSDYERSIVTALKNFPCTTYVFPLEDSIMLVVFHEGIRDIFTISKKFEEMGLSEDPLLSTPLVCVF